MTTFLLALLFQAAVQGLPVQSMPPVYKAVAAGIQFSCGLTLAESVYCWGSNAFGQLGEVSATGSLVPVAVARQMSFRQIAAGHSHVCALTEDGQAYCWGDNRSGQLGADTGRDCPNRSRCSRKPVAVSENLRFRQLSAGAVHTCGLAIPGQVYCWGTNRLGELGDESTRERNGPVPAAGALRFEQIMASGSSKCGLTTDRTAHCWGTHPLAPIGGEPGFTPKPFSLDRAFRSVQPGTCGLTEDGVTTCWYQQTSPDYSSGITTIAITATIDQTFQTLAGGTGSHSCGLTANGVAFCWDVGSYGDSLAGRGLTPRRVSDQLKFQSMARGFDHACGVTFEGAVYCWGFNSEGQLGNGGTAHSPAPVAVAPPQ